jgi:hypothetical protein
LLCVFWAPLLGTERETEPAIGESFVVILKEQFAPEASRERDSRVACLARSSLDTPAWRAGTTFERGRGRAHDARRRVHENVVLSRSLTRLSPSRPAAVRRDPLGALRSGHRQIEIQQSYLQTLPAASTNSEQFIRVAEIDLLDDHGLAKDRSGRSSLMPESVEDLNGRRASCERQSDLEQISAEDHSAAKVRLRGFDPHPIGDFRIIGRHKMGEDERLDAGHLRNAARVFD